MMGAGAQIFEMPSPTTWKMENGEWRWYVSRRRRRAATAFGKMKMGERGAADSKGEAPGGIEHPNLNALLNQVSIDRTSIEFTPDAGIQTATITNGLPGPMDLAVDPHAAKDQRPDCKDRQGASEWGRRRLFKLSARRHHPHLRRGRDKPPRHLNKIFSDYGEHRRRGGRVKKGGAGSPLFYYYRLLVSYRAIRRNLLQRQIPPGLARTSNPTMLTSGITPAR